MLKSKQLTSVAQSTFAWLPLTSVWLYNQLTYMDSIHSIVFARMLIEPERFPWEPIYTINQVEALVYKLSKRLGYRFTPAIFNRALQEQSVKIIHSHFGDMGWYDVPLAKQNHLKHIVTFYGLDVNMLPTQRPEWRKRYREMFAQADLFLCEGPFMASSLVQLGCPPEKVQVHRLGVEVAKVSYVPRRLDPGTPLKILIAGTFREKKGIPYALEAVGRLHQNGAKVQATVIGDSARGLAMEEAEKQKILGVIKQYGLESNVRLLGYQPFARLLAEAYEHHLFLSPSVQAANGDSEGGAPITLIDVMATGMPVVSTTHCDIPQVVLHETTGLLAEERNVAQLVTHLEWFLQHPEKWEELARNGRHHVEKNFNVQVQAEVLANLYRSLI